MFLDLINYRGRSGRYGRKIPTLVLGYICFGYVDHPASFGALTVESHIDTDFTEEGGRTAEVS